MPPTPAGDPRRTALLGREATALVVVDLQAKLVPAIHDRARILQNSALLLRLARILQIPTLLTSQYRKGLGPVLPEIQELAPEAPLLDKTSFGCFGDAGFTQALQSIDRRQLLVCGVEAHICVAQTVLAGLERGYTVHVVSDAVGARTAENRAIGLARMERQGAVLSSAEMAIYELLGRSDAPAFKEMLPYLKS
jgi:nicotinamidase-related amidase